MGTLPGSGVGGRRPKIHWLWVVAAALVVVASCGNDDTTSDGTEQRFPDVIDAEATRTGDTTWRFAVTISSPYDSPERYADAWRVLGPGGTELGVRVLTHPHASEQPFTRTLDGVDVPGDVSVVSIEGRDLLNGWGGRTFELDLTDEG